MRSTVRSLSAALLGAAALVAGCAAPVTKLELSWVSPQLPRTPFKKLLIITVASYEFVQIAFQDQMAAQLKERGVNAVASRRYFTRYTAAERELFKQSIDESDADFVLLARVSTTDRSARDMPYAETTGIYVVYSGFYYPGSYVPIGDQSTTTVTAEASIFAEKGEKLVWAARTRTTNAQNAKSGAAAATQYVAVILEAMKKDKVF